MGVKDARVIQPHKNIFCTSIKLRRNVTNSAVSWPSSKSSTSRSQERTDTSLPTISAFQVVPTAALNRSVSARRKLDVFVNKEDGTAGRRDPDCLRLARRPFNSLIECSTAITSSGLQAASAPTTTERRQIKVDRKSGQGCCDGGL